MVEATYQGAIYGIQIEGFGDATASATDQRYRWVWGRALLDGIASRDPDTLYLDGLKRWPREIGASVDFINGAVSTGTQSVELLGDALSWALLARTVVPVTGVLAAGWPLDPTDMVIHLSVTGLAAGTVIYLEREAIELGGEAPAYTYSACTRGVLGTQATSHGVDDDDDTEFFTSTMHPSTLSGRRVDLITIDIAAPVVAYGGETTVWSGVLREITLPTPETILLEIDDALSLVRGRQIMRRQWRGVLDGLTGEFHGPADPAPAAGHGATPQLLLRVNEDGPGITRYRTLGNVIAAGSLDPEQWTAIAGYPSGVPTVDEAIEGVGKMPAWELVTSLTEQPASAALVANNTLPISQNPGVAILQILLTTPDGNNSTDYDTGKAAIAGRIPSPWLDVAEIETWGTRNAPRIPLDNLVLGLEGEPEDLFEVIQDRILHMYRSVLIPGRGGLLTVTQFSDSPAYGDDLPAIDNTVILSEPSYALPVQARRLVTSIDNVQVTYGARLDGKANETIEARDHLNRQRRGFGEGAGFSLDAGATLDRDRAISVATGFVATFHNPFPLITVEVLRTVDVWPGEICTLSHDLLMGLDGTRGLAETRVLVVGRTEQLGDSGHSIRLELMLVGAGYTSDPCWIAPSGEVAAGGWVPATNKMTIEATAFATATSPITTDAGGFFDGDIIQICDSIGTVRVNHEAVEIVQVVGNVLELDPATLPAVPAIIAGDIVRIASYPDTVATQQGRWAFVCDTNGFLGAADPAKEYTNP